MSDPVSISLDTSSVTLTPEDNPTKSQRRAFLTPLPDLPGEFLLVLDNTSLDKIKRCHYAARNYLVLGREPHARNAALVFGGALHEGLELFHTEQFLAQKHLAEPPEDWDVYCPAAQDSAIRSFFLDNPTPPDDYRTVTNALAVMAAYRRRSNPLLYPDYEWEILADSEGPIIERPFELPLGVIEVNAEIPWPDNLRTGNNTGDDLSVRYVSRIHLAWSGRIDLVTRYGGRARITDHKTSSIEGDQFIQSFQISSQTIGYTWAAQQMWPDLNIEGFTLNCLRFKKPALSHKGDLCSSGPRGGDAPLNFFRSYFDYSPARVEQWRTDTLALIGDFIHSLVRDHFPLNDRSCFDKFGVCPYHDVCVNDDPHVREALLAGDSFKPVTWNPTTGRG